MTWFRDHLPALAIGAGSAIVLAGSLYFLDVVPRTPPQFETSVVNPGEAIDVDGYQLSAVSLSERGDEGLLPSGTQLYALDVDYVPPAEWESAPCIAATLVELDGQQRVFEVFTDGELLRELGDYPATCIVSIDGFPGAERFDFVLPDDHGPLAVVFGGVFSDRVQVAVAD